MDATVTQVVMTHKRSPAASRGSYVEHLPMGGRRLSGKPVKMVCSSSIDKAPASHTVSMCLQVPQSETRIFNYPADCAHVVAENVSRVLSSTLTQTKALRLSRPEFWSESRRWKWGNDWPIFAKVHTFSSVLAGVEIVNLDVDS